MTPYYQPKTYPASDFASTGKGEAPLPVVIAGAGPVGMAVALGLARRGVPVTVLEAADSVSFGSRAICISRHSLEVAQRLGFGDRLEEIALPWVGGRSFYRDREVLRFEMPHGEHDVRGPMVNVSQSELEQVMVDALLDNPLVTFHWSAVVSGVEQDGDEVRLAVDTAFGTRTLRARWVVAAEGGRSRLRDLCGLRLEGGSYQGNYVIADIHWPSGLSAERRVWFDAPSNPGSTIIMHRQPNDIWRIDYQLDAADDPEAETREDRIRDRIARHLEWLGSDVPWTLEWHGHYRALALALPEFVHGRVVFAGDAAHLVPIFGVRGLNSGMEDAETLAWQLAAVIGGRGDESLLRAYSAERRAAWRQNVDNADKSTLIMTPGSHGYRTTRDAILALATARPEFSHLLNPRQSSATHVHGSPLTWPAAPGVTGLLPGDPVQDRRVRVLTTGGTGGPGEAPLCSVLGSGFALVGFGLSASDVDTVVAGARRIEDALAQERARVVLVSAAGAAPAMPDDVTVLDDPDGSIASAFGARAGEVFVVRPDGLVLCRVTDLGLLSDVAGHLAAGTAPDGEVVVSAAASTGSPEERSREEVWLALSDALDTVAETDREGLLARLAMLLGAECGHETFARLLDVAVSTSKPGDRQVP